MIKIVAMKQHQRYSLRIKGHAGFSKGKDIVCAAVSALYYALAETAQKDEGVYFIKRCESDGSGEIEFTGGKSTEGAFKMALEGFSLLEKNFPKNVKLYERKD